MVFRQWKAPALLVALALGAHPAGYAGVATGEAEGPGLEASWYSPSLRGETFVGPNDAVTTRTALVANDKCGIGNGKRVEQVTDDVCATCGRGLASSFAKADGMNLTGDIE